MRLRADTAGIRRAAALIRAGGLVALPTETLYGLAVDALDPVAVARLVRAKGRPEGNPIPLIVADRAMLDAVVRRVPPAAEALIARHWPGPLTLVLPAAEGIPAELVGPGGGVGLRVSADPVARAVCAAAGRPITATSANLSGDPPATTAGAVQLPELDLVLDDGPRDAPPSTVVSLLGDEPRLLRQGSLRLDGLSR